MSLHFITEEATTAREGGVIELSGAEAHHASAVRRVRPGERVTIGDGAGVWLEGEVLDASAKSVTVSVTSRRDTSAPARQMTLVQALAKGDRDELAVQAATELGVDRIVPWQAERSVSRWDGEKARKGRARWQTIVREAAKQAHRSWLPHVDDVATSGAVSDLLGKDALLLVLDPTADESLSTVDLEEAEQIALLVGPEGGISPRELEIFREGGGRIVRLGNTVLRTSTAGPAAIALLSARIGRW